MSSSSLPGGPAAKAGDIHEALWGLLAFVRVLMGSADQIRIEVPGVDGAEFSLRTGDKTEWWQTKRQITKQKTWSLTTLKREGVLAFFAEKARAGDTCVFASISDAPELRELSDRARNAKSCEEFKSQFLRKRRVRHFVQLRGAWNNATEEQAYEWLKRVYVEGGRSARSRITS